ncbi:hypothetical protein AX17_005909 [Amanita inopinata Kibby_2008]|nr:hypothetical protein AX17_005909 [Amanita inopinata Kibby_2008]
MAPAFKIFRGILHSVRSTVMESKGSSDLIISKILAHQYASSWADVVFSNLMRCGGGQVLLNELRNDYRVSKFYTFKNKSRTEHEYVVVQITHGKDEVILLRIERTVGPKSTQSTPQDSNSSDPRGSLNNSSSKSSSSSTWSSIGSLLHHPEELIHHCKCLLSHIRSTRHWARDTIVRIQKPPLEKDSHLLRTVEYSGSPAQLPSLWDLVHLVQAVNQQCEEYRLLDAQCYWYADTVSGILESWCAPDDVHITSHHGWQGVKSKKLIIPAPGTYRHIVVHTRDGEKIEEQKVNLIEAIKASNDSVMQFLNADARNDALSRQLREAETRVQEMSRQLREVKVESESRLKEAETRIKQVESQAKARDAILAQIVTRLEDHQSSDSHSVVLADPQATEGHSFVDGLHMSASSKG